MGAVECHRSGAILIFCDDAIGDNFTGDTRIRYGDARIAITGAIVPARHPGIAIAGAIIPAPLIAAHRARIVFGGPIAGAIVGTCAPRIVLWGAISAAIAVALAASISPSITIGRDVIGTTCEKRRQA